MSEFYRKCPPLFIFRYQLPLRDWVTRWNSNNQTKINLWWRPLPLPPASAHPDEWGGFIVTSLHSPPALKKKLTENSASLTGCNRLTCKGDGKLFRHKDRVNPTSSDDEDGIFRNHRNFPMVFCSPAKEFSDNFRQLSDEWIIKSSTSGTRSHDLQGYNPLLYHYATVLFCECVWPH